MFKTLHIRALCASVCAFALGGLLLLSETTTALATASAKSSGGSVTLTSADANIVILGATSSTTTSSGRVIRVYDECPSSNIRVCGETMTIQGLPYGASTVLHLPGYFENSEIQVQCLKNTTKDRYFYKILNSPRSLCELKKCRGGSVDICGAQIEVKDEVTVFQKKKISIPETNFVESRQTYTQTVEIQCSYMDGDVRMETSRTEGLSCNSFPCEPRTLDICGTKVIMNDRATLGQTFSVKTERGEPVTVQCAGSLGQRPVYQVIDRSNVQCQ